MFERWDVHLFILRRRRKERRWGRERNGEKGKRGERENEEGKQAEESPVVKGINKRKEAVKLADFKGLRCLLLWHLRYSLSSHADRWALHGCSQAKAGQRPRVALEAATAMRPGLFSASFGPQWKGNPGTPLPKVIVIEILCLYPNFPAEDSSSCQDIKSPNGHFSRCPRVD